MIATHGRGLFVLDDITPLEESGAELAKSDFRLYPMQPAVAWHNWNKHGFASGGYVAPNPMGGAVITYYLPTEIKQKPEGERGPGERGGRGRQQSPVKITISDSSGQVVRKMNGTSKYGINRVSWNLRYEGPKRLNFLPARESGEEEEEFFFDGGAGPEALPGTYKVAVTLNGKTETQSVEVRTDPRFKFDDNALKAQFKLAIEVRDEVSALHETLNRLNSLHKQLTSMQDILGGDENQDGQTINASYKPVLEEARALDKKITAMESPLYNTEVQPGSQDDIHFLQRFDSRLQGVLRGVMGSFGEAPRDIVVEEANQVRKELDTQLQQFNSFLNTEVAGFNKKALQAGSSTLFAGDPVQIKASGGSSSGAGEDEDQDDPE